MAKPQEKQAFMSSGTSTTTTMDHEQEGYYYENEWGSSTTGCGCFRLFCFERSRGSDGEGNHLLHDRRGEEKTWFVSNLKKLKEGSEVLAGPKWKNFLRRLGNYFNKRRKSSPSSSSTHHNQFQYDPHSYALNFDDGDQEDGFLLATYQSRFTAPPSAVS